MAIFRSRVDGEIGWSPIIPHNSPALYRWVNCFLMRGALSGLAEHLFRPVGLKH